MVSRSLVFITIFVYFNYLYADESCVGVPISSDNKEYLEKFTIYGDVKEMIYIPDDKCSEKNDSQIDKKQITLCVVDKDYNKSLNCKKSILIPFSKILIGNIKPSVPNLIKNIPLYFNQVSNNKVCASMPTSRGLTPVVCRVYSGSEDDFEDEKCSNIAKACYRGKHSKSSFNFSGQVMECLQETLDATFFGKDICGNGELSKISSFYKFQLAFRRIIGAMLIMYVITFGIKIILNPYNVELNQIAMFIIKIIFVIYFAIGNVTQSVNQNGITNIVLPMVKTVLFEFSDITFKSSEANNLCFFDSKEYSPNYKYYALWDAIDCRVGYYFGIRGMYDNNPKSLFIDGDNKMKDWYKNVGDYFAFFSLLFGLFFGGNILLFIFCLASFLMIISMIFSFITLVVACIINLYILCYISPIFIPMVLFERTKDYFQNWVRLVISFSLQPMVVVGFIVFTFTMIDSVFYKECQFSGDFSNGKSIFKIDNLNNPDCVNSAGYKLIQTYFGEGWKSASFIIFEYHYFKDTLDLMSDMLYVFIYMLVFYFFSKIVNNFAADLTGGIYMNAIVSSPMELLDKIKSLIQTSVKYVSKS